MEHAERTLSMGAITLNVHDLKNMQQFYHAIIGLDVLQEDVGRVTLGFDNKSIVILKQSDATTEEPGSAGLYHLAILFLTQGDLARAVQRVRSGTPELFSGSADHLVSEAFYLIDPEGNGVELYYDRNTMEWEWENGFVKMDSHYISPEDYVQKHASSKSKESEVRLGHVHLRVGNIEEAEKFYVTIVGFAITSRMPSALFVSMDGYHHHIGMNTWESLGAGKRSDALGLSGFEILLHKPADFLMLKKRLHEATIAFEERDQVLEFSDPWNNRIVVSLEVR
jgi:catechol 2,3-dioxygenase